MRITKLHKVSFYSILVILAINLILNFETKASRKRNIDMINKERMIRYIPSSNQVHSKDPLFLNYFNHWSNKYYKLGSSHNSRTVEYLLEKNKRINDIIQNKKYDNLFNLFKDLRLLGHETEEFNLIKSWISYKNHNDWIYTLSDETSLIYYLEENYLKPSLSAFNNLELDKSKILTYNLYKRVRLIDKKVNNTDYYSNQRISNIYLTIMILNSPKTSLQEYSDISNILSISTKMEFRNRNDYNKISEWKSNNNNVNDIILYLKSVYNFRFGNYQIAKGILDEINNKENKLLNELVILLKVRCLFRVLDDNCYYNVLTDEQTEQYKNEMISLGNISSLKNFKNDINDYYLEKIIERYNDEYEKNW